MTSYNVHIYREMRLTFEHIDTDTPEMAAAIARDRLTEDADRIDDCDEETFAALVDVASDEQYEQSRIIDFEGERLRKAAPGLLEALQAALPILEAHATQIRLVSGNHLHSEAYAKALAAIVKATAQDCDWR